MDVSIYFKSNSFSFDGAYFLDSFIRITNEYLRNLGFPLDQFSLQLNKRIINVIVVSKGLVQSKMKLLLFNNQYSHEEQKTFLPACHFRAGIDISIKLFSKCCTLLCRCRTLVQTFPWWYKICWKIYPNSTSTHQSQCILAAIIITWIGNIRFFFM